MLYLTNEEIEKLKLKAQTNPEFIKQIEEISLSFTDIYLEGLSTFLKKKNSFKNDEEQDDLKLKIISIVKHIL